jgi:subtilisin family serine protease
LYTNNTDDRAYKSINLSGVTAGNLDYWAFVDTETSNDFFSVGFDSNGGDPFDGTNDTSLHTDSGSTLPFALAFSHNLNGCFTSNCSIGFRLTSNASNVLSGVGILAFEIHTLKTNSDGYENSNGTSMASPHVAGIATMVRAFNPNYSYTQTVEAIKEGGEVVSSLSGITTTGKAANAMGALAHITQPTGLAANVQ